MINIEKLSKIYGKRDIFSDFSYTSPDKGFVALIGSSGSGKSTLLNMISGVDKDYKGAIKIDGKNLKKMSSREASDFRLKNIGYVFQNFSLLNLDTVFNNVSLPLESCYRSKRFIRQKRVNDALEIVGLKELTKQRVNKLSGGEKQRVAIARALINDPKVILCDEPTGALDEKNALIIFQLLKRLSKNTLVIVATHDVESIKDIADVILEIKDSNVIISTSTKYEKEDQPNLLIGKGKQKRKPYIPLLFKIRYGFQKLKAKKFRSIIMNLMLSLSLTGIGLSMIITDSVSSKVEGAFNAILNGNYVIIDNKNENENSFTTTYSASLSNVLKIHDRYQYLLDGVGVNYLVNFEDFFKDGNDFYIESSSKKIPITSLSMRNVNDFRWLDEEETNVFYPYDYEMLDDDQVILGLTYEDMVNLCFNLQIQRNFSALGHFIYEKGLTLSFNVANNYWQYNDEQIFSVVAVCKTNSTGLCHTNLLWNEIVFEDMMRLPSDDDETHEYPWEIYRVYYLKTKEDPSIFLNSSIYDDFLFDYVFERPSFKYNPVICKPFEVCDEKRLYVYSIDKNGIQGSIINEYRNINKSFDTYYFTSDYGYASYASNLFSGFSKNVFVSYDASLVDEASDADTNLSDSSGVALNLPDGVIQGNYLLSLGDGIRFSTDCSKLIAGRKPININEIAISKGIANQLDKNGQNLGKYLEFSGEIEEFYDLEGHVQKTYGRTKALVVGIVDEEKNYLYQNSNWTIEFFRDKLGVSSFYLIPKNIVMEFKTQSEAKVAISQLEKIISGYKITSPIEELKTNINTTLEYANTILKAFSILAAVISILLLGTTMMLNIIESKNDIHLLSLLGVNKGDINSCFVVESLVQGLISFGVSSIELIIVDFVMSYMLGNMLGIGFKFLFNGKPVFVIFVLALLVPFVVSNVLLLILNRGCILKRK